MSRVPVEGPRPRPCAACWLDIPASCWLGAMWGKRANKWGFVVAGGDLPSADLGSSRDPPHELSGIVDVSLDERGRMAIPGRYRWAFGTDAGGGRAVVTIDRHERCLLAYPTAEWALVQNGLKALRNASVRVRRLQRMLIGFAFHIDIDRQGRLLVPPKLREYAGIERKAVVLGQINKLELWSADGWLANMEGWRDQNAEDDEEDREELRELRF